MVNIPTTAVLGNGYIASTLQDYTVFEKKSFDYTDLENLEALVTSYDTIIYASGFVGKPNVDACENHKEECWKLNVSIPTVLAMMCSQQKKKMILLSTGCMYTGYEKAWEESDTPNFGIFNSESSFYSKTKHAARIATESLPGIYQLQLRMPHGPTAVDRNYLMKLKNYPKLIDTLNSKTDMSDLSKLIKKIADTDDIPAGVYNCTNPNPVDIHTLIQLYKMNNFDRPDWEVVSDISRFIKANRSNCVLNTGKIEQYFKFRDEYECIEQNIRAIAKA